MTEYKMTDEKRELLTEKLLGECWHSRETWYDCDNGVHCRRRTFTTDTDMLAVFRKIRDIGMWDPFIACAFHKYDLGSMYGFTEWLFLDNPERALCIVSMWLEEQK